MDSLQALSALYASTCAIGVREDVDALVDEILVQAQRLVGFEHCGLVLFDAERQSLRVQRVRGYGDEGDRMVGMVLNLEQGLCGWAARHRQPLRVANVRSDPRYVAGLDGAHSSVVVPLMVRNQLVGVLNVESSRPDAFTEEHERLLTVFGTQAALAIEASRSQEMLARDLRRLRALYQLSQLAATPREPLALLGSMLEITQEVIPQAYCAILLLDPAAGTLTVRASRGYVDGLAERPVPVGQGVTGRCAQSGQVVVEDDLSRVPDYIPGVPGARSEVAVPMVADGRVIGVLNAESREPAAYREEHVQTLSVIGQQAATVLRAAQQHEEARRLAATDPLTGLPNRRHFLALLDENLRRARRYRETLAVAFLDLDDFKALNDSYGHNRGDRALQGIAGVLREWVRETDAVARMGGDEFAALLLRADHEGAWQALERLREGVHGLHVYGPSGERLPITISAGVALFPDDGGDAESLLGRADMALYQAKRSGKDRVALARRDVPRA